MIYTMEIDIRLEWAFHTRAGIGRRRCFSLSFLFKASLAQLTPRVK